MDTSILKMLDRAGEKYAGKVVYRDGEENITFGELKKQAQAVGSWIAKKLPPESPVSVLSGRNIITPGGTSPPTSAS